MCLLPHSVQGRLKIFRLLDIHTLGGFSFLATRFTSSVAARQAGRQVEPLAIVYVSQSQGWAERVKHLATLS